MKHVLQAVVLLAIAGVFVALLGWRGTLLLAGPLASAEFRSHPLR